MRFLYDKHRALSDRLAILELLARPLPASGRSALAILLQRARQPSFRLWAEGVRFEFKNVLKARGYRWSGGEDGRPLVWWRDLIEREALEAEIAHLREHVCRLHYDAAVRRVSAYDRYSERAWRGESHLGSSQKVGLRPQGEVDHAPDGPAKHA